MSTDMVRLHLSAERRLEGGVRVDELRAVDAVRHAGVVEHREEIVRREAAPAAPARRQAAAAADGRVHARARAAHRRRSCRWRVRTCRACASRGAQPERSRAPARRARAPARGGRCRSCPSTTVSAPASAIAVTTARTRASTSPSKGQPKAIEAYVRTLTSSACAMRTRSNIATRASSKPFPEFALLCVSVHENCCRHRIELCAQEAVEAMLAEHESDELHAVACASCAHSCCHSCAHTPSASASAGITSMRTNEVTSTLLGPDATSWPNQRACRCREDRGLVLQAVARRHLMNPRPPRRLARLLKRRADEYSTRRHCRLYGFGIAVKATLP